MDKFKKNTYRLICLCLPILTSSLLINLLFLGTDKVKAQEINPINVIAENNSQFNKSATKSKPRIAIFDFDYSSVGYYDYWHGYVWGNGRGVSSILVDKLVKSGNFRVIEREKIDSILKEQNLGTSGRVDASTAAQLGRLLGAELVVFGAVTSANLEQSRGNIGGVRVPIFGAVGASRKKRTANVKINVRVVNTTTGEIVLSAEGNGRSNKTDGGLSTYKFYINKDSNADNQLLTLATADAINQISEQLNTGVDKAAVSLKSVPNINAVIADTSVNTVILNKGSADGYRQGMKLSIEQIVKIIKDPVTGQELRKLTKQIGMIELTEVDTASSVGKIISGAKFKVGDIAKPVE